MKKISIGIDPGLSGCLVAVDWNTLNIIDFINVSMSGDLINVKKLSQWLNQFEIAQTVVYCENPHTHPSDGIKTVYAGFRYGYSVGTLQALPQSLGYETKLVLPVVWKKYYGLLAPNLTHSERKYESTKKAIDLTGNPDDFMEIKQSGNQFREICLHDKAESYLIARYGIKIYKK